jgi:hypothetical protein
MSTQTLTLGVTLGACALSATVSADTIDVSYGSPSLDRWVYPFNGTPGTRFFSSIFGAVGEDMFDNRDGQMLVGFDTADQVTTGLGVGAYTIVSATLTIQYDGQTEFVFDASSDSYVTYLEPAEEGYQPDADPGRPLELFGAGFRNGFDVLSFVEDAPHGPIFGVGVRNAHALGFAGGAPIDVSNNVRFGFDPVVWSVGQIDVPPGEVVPANAPIEFEIDVSDPSIQAYLAEALDTGLLRLFVTSMHSVVQQGGSFPSIYNKENPLVIDGLASAATLDMTVEVDVPVPGDVTGDGVVDVQDIVEVITNWGDPYDVEDLIEVITNWG